MGWYDSITEDLDRLKELAVDLGETVTEAFGNEESASPVDRKIVDDWIRHLATRAAPRQWAEPARDAIKATQSWLDTNASSPDHGEVVGIHRALVDGEACFQSMRDWHQTMQRLWDLEEACVPRPDDRLETLQERRSNVELLERRLEKRWEDSIEDRKVIVAFRPRIQKPTGAFEGLFDQMNNNQKMIAEGQASLNRYREQIDEALVTAAADQQEQNQRNADNDELDSVHKCVTDGILEDTSKQLSETIFTDWFESKASRWYPGAAEGQKISIPVSEFDCSDPNYYPGIQRDGAIKAVGSVSTVNRQMGPMYDPESEGVGAIDFTFTTYFTAKSQKYKMSSIYEFTRTMSVNYTDGALIEGVHDFVKGFSRTGGDDQPVHR